MTTTSLNTFSYDTSFSLRQCISFTSDSCKWNFFILDINSWFVFRNSSLSFFISHMRYRSSNFDDLINWFLSDHASNQCFNFASVSSSRYRIEMTTTPLNTFSYDTSFSLRQCIGFTSDSCKRNFFVLDDNTWFGIRNRSNSFFVSYVSDRSSDLNHLIDSFFCDFAFKNCFGFLTIFSSN